jgi:hypothetical protein
MSVFLAAQQKMLNFYKNRHDEPHTKNVKFLHYFSTQDVKHEKHPHQPWP